MIILEIAGSPIGGENPPHEQRWRARVAACAAGQPPASEVALHFRMEPRRKVDLDNLVRPALAGLRDAGVFTRGFPGLHVLLATKAVDPRPGLQVVLDEEGLREASPPGPACMRVAAEKLPRDGHREGKTAWREHVRKACDGALLDRATWVDITVRTPTSLEGVLKPVIDGLEPLLGRDPGGRLEFVPNDDLITWLRVVRDPALPSVLSVTAGPISG